MGQKAIVHRYAPFLVIVALLALVMIIEPASNRGQGQSVDTGGGLSTAAGSTGVGASTGADGSSTGGVVGAGAVGGGADAVTAGGGATSGAAGGAGGAGGGSTGAGSAAASGQQVDALGRPLAGDKGKCAAGGLLQEAVTLFSLPCMPKFVGDNGGSTYQGVTKDEITIVVLVQHYTPAVQAALTAVGLAATDQQYQEASDVFATFINKHYELFGRKIKAVVRPTDCVVGDNPCFRADAKATVAKLKPFAVVWNVPGTAPEAFMDEISRQKVIGVGAPPIPTEWFTQRRPYIWTEVAQSPVSLDNLADYYCKKMWGKNATLAGDPRMRVQRRKLGIIVTEDPNNILAAQHFRQQVTGGLCGSPSDGTQMYTISANTDTAEAQRPTLVTRMKNDGINTSLQLPSTDVLGCKACDQQQYFPENLISGQNQNDADIVGRLDASAQRQNRFGIGFRPAATPLNDHGFRKAAHDVNPSFTPEYITEGPYLALTMISRMIQLAGPKLNPVTVEQGAHTMVQLGGFNNPKPWPGWRGGNPAVPKWSLAGANKYSAWSDAREIYWDNAAVSPDDGQPGAWVCVGPCRRYEAGEWPKGEPKQP